MVRQFKDSGIEWIGKIPELWNTCQLKRLLMFQNGQDYKHVESDCGYPVYGSGGVFMHASQYLYDGEAILFGRKGTIDRPLYVNEKFWTVDTMYYAIPKSQAIGRYLYYLATLLPYTKYQTSTALPSMTQSLLGNMVVALPYIQDQQHIAEYLDEKCGEIDSLIALQEQMIEKLKIYKQSIITETVTKGLDTNAKLVPSGIDWIGEVPEGWKVSVLRRFANIILGKMLQPNAKSENDSLEQYICAKDVHFEGIDTSDLKKMFFNKTEKETYQVQKGDLLVVEGGAGAAGSCVLKTDLPNTYIQNSIMIVRPKQGIDIRYIHYFEFSLAKKGYVDYVCNKATIPHFTKDKLSSMPIPLPPFSEQQTIASYLDEKCADIDSLIVLKLEKIEKLKDYKKSVVYEAVTGKTIID